MPFWNQLELDEELVELATQRFEALEEEDEERAQELWDEIRDFLSLPSTKDAPTTSTTRTKSTTIVDAARLPVPVTEELLGRFRDVDFHRDWQHSLQQ